MNKPDHLYFVQCGEGGPIKIGITHSPKQRFSALQTACPYPLSVLYVRKVEDAPGQESALHRSFAKYRLSGEWFLPAKSILRLVQVITAANHRDAFGFSEEEAAA